MATAQNPERKNPKMGTITKEGIVVGRGANQRVVPTDEIFKLAKLGCTLEEMADWFEVNRETLKYNFKSVIDRGRAETKQTLRRAQIQLALGGNASMLIWLGKNMLGQSDQGTAPGANDPLPWED
jgi:hypothetical protein